MNDIQLAEKLSRMHHQTIILVGNISKTVILDQFAWPQLAVMHIWYSDCYHLFRQALGFQEETLDIVFRRLKMDFEDISVYLRSLVMTDVYNKILVSEFPDLPIFSRQWVDKAFDPMIRKCECLECSCSYLLNHTGHAASQAEMKSVAFKTLARQVSVNKNLAELPEKLAGELFEALNPLLLCYKSPAIDREASRARKQKLQELHGEQLMKIYEEAINLRKEMSNKAFSYTFFWIDAGESFNEAIMDAEVHYGRKEFYKVVGRGRQVVATVLPGVIRHDSGMDHSMPSSDPSKERNIVLRALVYLDKEIHRDQTGLP